MEKVMQEIKAIGDEMQTRLFDNMQDGMTTAEGEFALGDSDVCISMDATGVDIDIYDAYGNERCLPNIEMAVRKVLPNYDEMAEQFRLMEMQEEQDQQMYRDICHSYGWSCMY